ncbi:MAG: hypothetical protein ACSLE5_11830 [Porticoccaceae bacterium]
MRIIVTVLALLMVSGCVSQEQRKAKFFQSMDAFVGGTADDLVLAKGPPSNSFTLTTGGRVFEYSRNQTVTSGGGSYPVAGSVFVGDRQGGGWISAPSYRTFPVTTSEYYCKILVKISPANLVESWSSEGNDCY